MKGIYRDIINIRRKIFAEIARLAYEDVDLKEISRSLFNVVPGEVAQFRGDIFKERAIVGERLRLALGLDVREVGQYKTLSEGVETINMAKRMYTPPLLNVIPYACEACPSKTVEITHNCRKCIGHPCINTCPKDAISFNNKQAIIDKDKCIKCGKCIEVCPYNAIIKYDKPCAVACGVGAIENDEHGHAHINQDKCVSCGQCMQACPFGAISDKSQIYQLVKALKAKEEKIYAIVAPAFLGQFGPMVSPEQLFAALKKIGFDDVIEVGLGADIGTIHEAEEFISDVPEKVPYMGTSCCPAWLFMVQKQFPDQLNRISDTATPMIATATHIKKGDEKSKVVFIGPCIAKKLEALRDNVRDYVDFVITYEELMGIFVAKGIELGDVDVTNKLNGASRLGRGYSQAGGVAEAVKKVAERIKPGIEVKVESANGLHECVKLMKLAKAGKKNGYLLEGMACPGGCIGGPGTIVSLQRAQKALLDFKEQSEFEMPMENPILKE